MVKAATHRRGPQDPKEGVSTKSLLLNAGIGHELNSALALIKEDNVVIKEDNVVGSKRWPRFTPKVSFELKKNIVNRSYYNSLFELCHFVRIASACSSSADRYIPKPHFRSGYKKNIIDEKGNEEFFAWDGESAKASNFRAKVAKYAPSFEVDKGVSFKVDKAGVNVIYSDGPECFKVTFVRMPYLSALRIFLIDVLGFKKMDEILSSVTETDVKKKTISDQSKKIEKLLYKFLDKQLPKAQKHRSYKYMIRFMEKNKRGNFNQDDFDDECIMTFWERNSTVKGLDFKDFATTFKSFISMSQTVKHALDLHELDRARSIGKDRDAGEIDLDSTNVDGAEDDLDTANIYGAGDDLDTTNVYGAGKIDLDAKNVVEEEDTLNGVDGTPGLNPKYLDLLNEDLNPLLALSEGPAKAIKFINKQEFNILKTLFDSGSTGLGLPLSLMRCEVFGKGQKRIAEALRRERELKDLIENCAKLTFKEKVDELREINENLDRVLLASLHALLVQRDNVEVTLYLIKKLDPEVDLLPVKKLYEKNVYEEEYAPNGNVIPFSRKGLAQEAREEIEEQANRELDTGVMYNALTDYAKISDGLNNLVQRAKKEFDGLSRVGFRSEDAGKTDIQDGFSEGVEHLVQVRDTLRVYLEKFETANLPEGGWMPQFEKDRQRFAQQFKNIYGEKS